MANEDKSTRYHRLGRRVAVAGIACQAALLLVLLATGAAAALARAVEAVAGPWRTAPVALYATVLIALIECARLPFACYQGLVLERRYGLSVQPTAAWWLDRVKSSGLSLVFGVPAAIIVWALLRLVPDVWWLAASVLFLIAVSALAHAAPVLLMPLFYRVTPLERPALERRLLRLAERAGARVFGVFEWRLGDRTRKANAVLAGTGSTRRILLSDTLLSAHSDDEIEVILAHELAHHVHGDIRAAIVLETGLMAVALAAADRALGAFGPALGLAGKADLAGMPLVALVVGGMAIATAPLALAVSRRHERRADRFALDLTGNAEAFVSAMRRLSSQNLAEERPSRLVELLFHSHPSSAERIELARRWAASADEGGALGF